MIERRLTSILAIFIVACTDDQQAVDAGPDATSDATMGDASVAPDVAPDAATDAAIDSCLGSQTDPKNCGACGVVCGSDQVCSQGKCSCAAQDGAALTLCTGDGGSPSCTDTNTDSKNCGGCNVVCTSMQACTNGTCTKLSPKIVFVSSVQYGGNLGGLNGADAKCQALATAASLPGNYKAWLSDDNTTAASRLTHASVAYVLYDGTTVVASDWTGLTSGTLQHAIDRTEDGGSAPIAPFCLGNSPVVFSNTLFNGTQDAVGFNCTNWTGVGTKANFGNVSVTDARWSAFCSANTSAVCDGTYVAGLYCVEQ